MVKKINKFNDNLPRPDNLDYTDLIDDELDKDYELFKCSNNYVSIQSTINSYFNNIKEELIDIDS